MVKLPPRETDEGAESRLLLSECRGPSASGYNIIDATSCMQLMDRVLYNRVKDPKPYFANAPTLLAVIRARNQFNGFEHYPNYSTQIANRIQGMIDIANTPADPRSSRFIAHINAALTVTRSPSITDPSPRTLAFWRTAGTNKPTPTAKLFKTLGGIDFYYVP